MDISDNNQPEGEERLRISVYPGSITKLMLERISCVETDPRIKRERSQFSSFPN